VLRNVVPKNAQLRRSKFCVAGERNDKTAPLFEDNHSLVYNRKRRIDGLQRDYLSLSICSDDFNGVEMCDFRVDF
jgi:hypothetical protein